MTPVVHASARTSGASHPVITSASPVRRAHRAKDPPISPTPTIVICLNCISSRAGRALPRGESADEAPVRGKTLEAPLRGKTGSAGGRGLRIGRDDSINRLSDQSKPLYQGCELF